MKLCPICKAENEDTAKECILCGTELKTESEVDAQPPPPSPQLEATAGGELPPPPPLDSGSMTTRPPQTPTGDRYTIRKAFSDVQTPLPKSPPAPKKTPSPGSTLPPEFSIRTLSAEDSDELKSPTSENKKDGEPEIPPPGTLCLVVYHNRKPVLYFPIIYEEILIGRMDPSSNSYPDLDLTPFDPELAISRKHCYILREGDNYYIYPISNSGTQVEQELVDIGTKKKLKEGDVIILSGRVALRFYRIPPAPK